MAKRSTGHSVVAVLPPTNVAETIVDNAAVQWLRRSGRVAAEATRSSDRKALVDSVRSLRRTVGRSGLAKPDREWIEAAVAVVEQRLNTCLPRRPASRPASRQPFYDGLLRAVHILQKEHGFTAGRAYRHVAVRLVGLFAPAKFPALYDLPGPDSDPLNTLINRLKAEASKRRRAGREVA